MGDIDAICDRTIIVNHGTIVIDKPTSELRNLHGELEDVIAGFYVATM